MCFRYAVVVTPVVVLKVSINTARTALSSVSKPVDGIMFGAQESLKRFLKETKQDSPTHDML